MNIAKTTKDEPAIREWRTTRVAEEKAKRSRTENTSVPMSIVPFIYINIRHQSQQVLQLVKKIHDNSFMSEHEKNIWTI